MNVAHFRKLAESLAVIKIDVVVYVGLDIPRRPRGERNRETGEPESTHAVVVRNVGPGLVHIDVTLRTVRTPLRNCPAVVDRHQTHILRLEGGQSRQPQPAESDGTDPHSVRSVHSDASQPAGHRPLAGAVNSIIWREVRSDALLVFVSVAMMFAGAATGAVWGVVLLVQAAVTSGQQRVPCATVLCSRHAPAATAPDSAGTVRCIHSTT